MKFLLLFFIVLSTFSAVNSEWRIRGMPSGYAKIIVENQIHALKGAVKSRNDHLFQRLYNVQHFSEIFHLFDLLQMFSLKVVSAEYTTKYNTIIGLVKDPNFDTTGYIMLKSDPISPTGWKIFELTLPSH